MRPTRTHPILLFIAGIAVLLACSSTTPTDKDLLELERVGQYLRAFSLYQEPVYPNRVPARPLEFDTPEDLAHSINDTLYDSNRYTYYVPASEKPENWLFGKAPVATGGAWVSSTVEFEPNWSLSAAYLRISLFDSTTLDGILAVSTQKPELVVDLRDNHGGNIDICTTLVELFLPAGKPYITTTYRKNVWSEDDTGWVRDRRLTSRRSGNVWEGKLLAVWINGESASAAEIFAAALRDGLGSQQVRLIGERTFGKGIGQYLRLLDSGGAMSITGLYFKRVSADSTLAVYHLRGIDPDVTADARSESELRQQSNLFFSGGTGKSLEGYASPLRSPEVMPLGYSLLVGPEEDLQRVMGR